MKKTVTLIIVCICIGCRLTAQSIPDGGFETWTTLNWLTPDNYQTSNNQEIPVYQNSANAIRTADAWHGSYAIKVSTLLYHTDTLTGYVSNGFDPVMGTGGVAYGQKPTGIRLYYKCSIVSGDSASCIVIFKKSGVKIGTYLYQLTGTVSTYTLLARTFSPALSSTPDTVIFAVAAGNINSGKKASGTPGNTITIDSVTFTGVSSQPAMLNGDFENWHTDSILTLPGWDLNLNGVYRTTDAYAGSYALAMQTFKNYKNNVVNSAVVTTGQFASKNIIGGHPFTNKVDTLVFYYKFAPAISTDSANIGMAFKKGGINVGNVGAYLPASASYKLVQIPINLGSTPDSVLLLIESSINYYPSSSSLGSLLKVDNIHFKSQHLTTTIEVATRNDVINIYPNPTTGRFTIDLTTNYTDKAHVQIINLLGQVVYEQLVDNVNGKVHATLNTPALPNGVYLVKVSVGGESAVQRLLITN